MFNKKKYSEDQMQEAINRATELGIDVGYRKAIRDANQVIDAHGLALGLKPSYPLVVKQAEVILQMKEAKGEAL